jgi:hypothetical protein
MIRILKITLCGTIFATAMLFLTASASQAAVFLGISRDADTPGEKWVEETRERLRKLTGEVGVAELIRIGAPAYRQIMGLVERGRESAFPELVAGELSKVAEYGGAEPEFNGKSERYAKKALVKAASYLPAKVIQRIPALEARTVIGRSWFRHYDSGRVVIKVNNVKISLHELGHALEYSSGHLLRVRREFYENRTRGKSPGKLNCLNLPFSYEPDEEYRAGFVSRYMGKEGGVEVLSCGIEYVFFNSRDIWRRDPEVTKLILGILIFYGSEVNCHGAKL